METANVDVEVEGTDASGGDVVSARQQRLLRRRNAMVVETHKQGKDNIKDKTRLENDGGENKSKEIESIKRRYPKVGEHVRVIMGPELDKDLFGRFVRLPDYDDTQVFVFASYRNLPEGRECKGEVVQVNVLQSGSFLVDLLMMLSA